MRIGRTTRWEITRALRSKQYLVMTLLIPALAAAGIVAATAGEARAALREPPPPYLIGVILAMILFIGAFMSGVMVLYSVVKEKQNRVVEIILSSVSATEMMVGKVLGQGAAGLLQVSFWVACAYAIASRFAPVSLAELELVHWVTYPLYFTLGYLFIASLYAAVGAAMKDIQSGGASGLVGLVPYAPILFAQIIITQPESLLVRLAGFFPPFVPSVMMFRIGAVPLVSNGLRQVPAWEIALSFASLLLGVVAMMRFAARIFETGLLMYGKSPSVRELWRWGLRRRR
ncbi:MAG: ABC transporter permease [Candidatus Bipolaricaulota bacterium]